MLIGLSSFSQAVFIKTEFDFGSLAKEVGHFEEDFLFRNTGSNNIKILSVRSVQSALSFIYTRSDVLTGEYGFVKVKIHTDSLQGLFHDEVYITLKDGDDIKSEVIYIRARINKDGKKKDLRAFEDGAISTSVEVSPQDIETMEGFLGSDKLSRAESEITFLKKQVALKSDLIAKLSDDLFNKQAQEKENFERLASLEKVLKENNEQGNTAALSQLNELSSRLTDMRTSDSLLRSEINNQEKQYDILKSQADSARNYAQDLSAQLQAQFESEARAMEKAQILEVQLQQKKLTERQQQERIDSLSQVLKSGINKEEVSKEIMRLRSELIQKKKEQAIQENQSKYQQEKIELLKKENDFIKQSADSLSVFAASSADENERLLYQLEQSNGRISNYESKIDSLQQATAEVNSSEKESIEELERLRTELANIETQDAQLKESVIQKEQELARLEKERDETKKNMDALERATTKQQEQAHNLMYRINGLAEKETQAQLEIKELRLTVKQSRYKEDSTRQSVNELVSKIGDKEASIKTLSSQIELKESELTSVKKQRLSLQSDLQIAQGELSNSDSMIDSLKQQLNKKEENSKILENDILALHNQVISSQQKEADYKAKANDLENRLTNAHLSNDFTFQELKGDIEAMRIERESYKKKYERSELTVEQLQSELIESKRNEESAIAFANELSNGQTPLKPKSAGKVKVEERVVYSINVISSDEALDMAKTFKNESNIREYIESGRYRYAIGQYNSLGEAIKAKETMKAKGYSLAFIVAFKNDKRISLKEALESAKN
jgi:chromosome segregation ATPase